MTTSRTEPAGIWVRVSSGKQDEQNQVPEVERYCADHDYRIERRYELNDKRASIGEQDAKLNEMLHDMLDGTITVLVCWMSSRLDRRGVEAVFSLLRKVNAAGGRIGSVKDGLLTIENVSGQVLTSVKAIYDHQFSVELSENVKLAHDRIRARGGVGPGGTPWGYVIAGKKYNKQLIPADLCRKYAPQIFARVIVGESYRAIAEWLDAEGVPPKRGDQWYEGSVRKLIRNRIYAGRWQNEAKTKTITYCEPVVSADVWERANAAIKRQPYRKPTDKDNRPILANLRCARCEDSPMNLIRIKGRDGETYYSYYRCAGRGARRKGCGNMVSYDATNAIVTVRVILTSNDPHETRHWVEGESYANEISNVKQDLREAVEAEQFDRMPVLQAQLTELRDKQEHAPKGHWERKDTGLTVGEYFGSLDAEGKREYLKTRDIRVEKATPILEPGASKGIRVIIDGKDHGVFPYPSLIS